MISCIGDVKLNSSIHPLADQLSCSLHRHIFFQKTTEWKKNLASLSLEQLNTVIEEVCQKEDSPAILERLAQLIPLDKLQEAIRIRDSNVTDAIRAASSKLKEAEHYLNVQNQAQLSPSIRSSLNNILDALTCFLESILDGLGIAEFFEPSEKTESKFKVQKLLTFASIFALLATILTPLIGAASAAWVITGLLLTIAALSIIYPAICPPATYFPVGKNWTRLLQAKKLVAIEGRKESLNLLANNLIVATNVKKHPLLIGPSGIGKTETVKAFAQAVSRGDYPDLKGKQIIYFNTADLIHYQDNNGKGVSVLDRISEIMGRHQEEFILVFDEIHCALKKSENQMGEQLKTKLDSGSSNFPHVIGITTNADYAQYIAPDKAFCRRFTPIIIEAPDPYETLAILSNVILRIAPQTMVEDGALTYLFEQTNKLFPTSPQPLAAQKILMACIQTTADTQHSTLEQQAETLQSKIESIHAQSAANSTHKNALGSNEVEDLENRLREFETKITEQKMQISQVFKARNLFAKIKEAAMKTTVRAATLKKTQDLSSFIILNYFKMPLMEKRISENAERLGISAIINRQLIDRAIDEEAKKEEKFKNETLKIGQEIQQTAMEHNTQTDEMRIV